jgi:two-component system catabolic regulation response regulator CreB
MPQPRILLIEDEPAIADNLLYALRTEGFGHAWKATGGEGLRELATGGFDLVVLDIGLPDTSGFEVCREIRKASAIPILFLTARQAEVDRIVGLELGADDYVTKPFSPREVTARIKAILRRSQGALNASVSASAAAPARAGELLAWAVDEERCTIRHRGVTLALTRNEFRLLKALLARPGRVFTREELLQAAWDEPEASMDRTVDAHVKSLRAKIRLAVPESDPIETRRGLGYALREDS